MDNIDPLSLVLRLLHILSAITLMGGTIFMRFALSPAASELPDDAHQKLRAGVIGRWKIFVMAASGFLLLSGLVNYILTVKAFAMPKLYHPLFGVKFLLALPIFFIASLLTGRTALADKIRQNAKMWLTVNLILATLVVAIGSTMRSLSFERQPKNKTAAVQVDEAK